MEQRKEDVGTKKDLMLYRLENAKSDLKSAKILFAAEEYKAANNRAYYAIFPREIGRKIGEAEEIRHASDYDDFYIASKEESERQIAVAEEFLTLIGKYCMTLTEEENS